MKISVGDVGALNQFAFEMYGSQNNPKKPDGRLHEHCC